MVHDDFSNNCENNTRFTMRDLKMNLQSNADGPTVDLTGTCQKLYHTVLVIRVLVAMCPQVLVILVGVCCKKIITLPGLGDIATSKRATE